MSSTSRPAGVVRRFMVPMVCALATTVPLRAHAQSPDATRLAAYALSVDAAQELRMPADLAELSGLAMDRSGRLFAHEDETSTVYEIDPVGGGVVRRFHVARRSQRGDFEGIAIAGSRFFLTTSDGDIYEFRAAADGEVATHHRHRTELGDRCEIEGLAYEPATGMLLLPCKVAHRRSLRERVTVFAVDPDTWDVEPEPRVSIPWDRLEDVGLDNAFHPSAIEVHPVTGSLFILAGREATILEVAPDGALLAGRELRKADHPQPEGLTFGPDLSLWLADERDGGGTLLRYEPREPDAT